MTEDLTAGFELTFPIGDDAACVEAMLLELQRRRGGPPDLRIERRGCVVHVYTMDQAFTQVMREATAKLIVRRMRPDFN